MTTPASSTHPPVDGLPKISYGQGSYLYDTDGKQYIDGSGGPAVYCLGHANAEVNLAVSNQMNHIAHGYRYNFSSQPMEDLTDIIVQRCGPQFGNIVFVSGGSEAVEACLKLALQYHSARGDMTRRRFIARQRSWHGTTLGALSVSGFLERRAPFEGALVPASHVTPVNAYRPPIGCDPDDVARFCAQELEDEIVRLGPENVAAFIFEPVVGAAGGCVPAPPGYAQLVRDICDRYGVLLIADEVMCGTGRTGYWRALSEDGVAPDLMSIAKGLAGGYLPLGAAIYSDRVSATINNVYGAPSAGHTFTAHTACCAAGVAVQTIMQREQLVERVRAMGPVLHDMLAAATDGIAHIGDIRGRGFFQAVELVADPATREPFPASARLAARIRRQTLDNGLICYPVNGNVDGVNGDCVIVAPAFNATNNELIEIVDKLALSLRQVFADKPSRTAAP